MDKLVIKLWGLQEITLYAKNEYSNPYMDVDVWIKLTGPGFQKKIYGFWVGDKRFIIRFVATVAGDWHWESCSNTDDTGLNSVCGSFTAEEWNEEELVENPCRRGFLNATPDGHGFQFADGTAHYYLADTWWGTPTYRYPWVDEVQSLPDWAEMSFQEMVEYRRKQGFNGIAMLAGLPNWATDGRPSTIILDDEEKTPLRHAWQLSGSADLNDKVSAQAKNMHNEGGRPFHFPGLVEGFEDIVPDYTRINPEYFKYMDRKVAYLNSQGFIPFIEVSRRDAAPSWKKFYDFNETYSRYIHYIFCRYQAYNVLLSPIHYDYEGFTIPSREFNAPANLVVEKYGLPPFGTLVSANCSPSTFVNFGGPDEAKWLSFHQIGNYRPHDTYWYLTDIYNSEMPLPALNGEPYYPGFPDNNPKADSETAERYCRSGMYGSFLSGGFAGYMYGVEGMWGGNIEEEAEYKMWDSLKFRSGAQVQLFKNFVESRGADFQSLIPCADMVIPNQMGKPDGYDGWAFCAHTKNMEFGMLYFEKECPRGYIRKLSPNSEYNFNLYDPRTGQWNNPVLLETDQTGRLFVPDFPSNDDWAATLERL